jgi:hypothetical protein
MLYRLENVRNKQRVIVNLPLSSADIRMSGPSIQFIVYQILADILIKFLIKHARATDAA